MCLFLFAVFTNLFRFGIVEVINDTIDVTK